jgi:hypothetical protein
MGGIGTIDGKDLYERVFKGTVQVTEGTDYTTFCCLAGCVLGSNANSTVFKIPRKQRAQAVTDHCKSKGHFWHVNKARGLCTTCTTSRSCRCAAVVAAHQAEVLSFNPKRQAKRKRAVVGQPGPETPAQSSGPATTTSTLQLQRYQKVLAKMNVQPTSFASMAAQGQNLTKGKSR